MKKILLVEDNVSIQDAARQILERAGYRVDVLFDGDTLVEGAHEPPDIYILDKQLAGIDGLEICAYLKQQAATRDIPIIMLSANPHIGRMAKAAGANDVLEKPFNMRDLREMVAKYISA